MPRYLILVQEIEEAKFWVESPTKDGAIEQAQYSWDCNQFPSKTYTEFKAVAVEGDEE